MPQSVASRHLRSIASDVDAAYQGVDESAYDADGFYVTSVNKHDHRAETRVAMKPETKNAIDALIASGDFKGTPVNTYQAFMRDAAVHNLHRLSRLTANPNIAAAAERARQLALIDQMRDERASLRKIVDDADEGLTNAIKDRDVFMVDTLVAMYEGIIATIRDPYAVELEGHLEQARRWLRAHRE